MSKEFSKDSVCEKYGVSNVSDIPVEKADQVRTDFLKMADSTQMEIFEKNPQLVLAIYNLIIEENRRNSKECYDACKLLIDNLQRDLDKTFLWHRKQKLREQMMELTDKMIELNRENKNYMLINRTITILGVLGIATLSSLTRKS
ncbi:MAG: hypothetical protein J6A77_03365 [Lachnospiraceae bacterium]|nr:hypothetical protein [Lachnospiraceae bacterium]